MTNEGRLKHQWQQAIAESDVQIRLAKLRLIKEQLLTSQTKFVHLWLPFLDDFLSSAHIHVVTERDIKEVEKMGDLLLHTSSDQDDTGEIWRRAIHAYTLRDEGVLAYALLTRMFHSPSIKNEWKDWAAWQLAERGASGDDHLSIYMYYIQHTTTQTPPKSMLAI